MRALLAAGEEPAAAARLRALLLEENDPRLRYLLGRILVRMGKEVEGSQEIELAREELAAVESALEDLFRELDDLLVPEEDEPDPGACA